MKKLILIIIVAFSINTLFVSCKENKETHKDEHNSKSEHASEKADIALNDLYQCPMNCEDGKTYDEEGTCPVCAMELKKVEGKHQHDDGEPNEDEGKEHDDDSEHKEGTGEQN